MRTAVFEDAAHIARMHDEVWRATYRDLATPAAWEALTEEVRRARWEEVLGETDPQRTTLVAERAGRLVGFGTACAPTEETFAGRGEIRWLHVDPSVQGAGIGRRLMSALAGQLADWGYGGCALAVVVGNARAIAFYERLGGRRAGGFTDPGPLWRSDNIVFVWDELSLLIGDGHY
ncbi:GNAT family N-acetyltransferase [Phenylobacterium sp.]|uniref:GNAT family N-acetyltransferase n=1 Tax=Phenylobacterium sp. TaxID=1871053 RepID=UPI0025D30AF6|nr:GNAT family N-acetyltransferase [Phenylobacterium sp.]